MLIMERYCETLSAYRRLYDPQARLHIVGSAISEEYQRAVEHFVAELELGDAVDWAGSVTHEELMAYYDGCDVFLCLSEHEGFNVPVLEAMHFHIPVIAYAAAAVPGTVGDGGILLTDKDPVIVATAVERLRSDTSLRQALVEAGRKRVEHYSIERTGPEWIETLSALMQEPG